MNYIRWLVVLAISLFPSDTSVIFGREKDLVEENKNSTAEDQFGVLMKKLFETLSSTYGHGQVANGKVKRSLNKYSPPVKPEYTPQTAPYVPSVKYENTYSPPVVKYDTVPTYNLPTPNYNSYGSNTQTYAKPVAYEAKSYGSNPYGYDKQITKTQGYDNDDSSYGTKPMDSYEQSYETKPTAYQVVKPTYKSTQQNYGESSSYGQQSQNYEAKSYEVKPPTIIVKPTVPVYTPVETYGSVKSYGDSYDSGSSGSYDAKQKIYNLDIPKIPVYNVKPSISLSLPPSVYGTAYTNQKQAYGDSSYNTKKTVYVPPMTASSYGGSDSYGSQVPSYKPPVSTYQKTVYGGSKVQEYNQYGNDNNYGIPSAVCPSKYAEPIYGGVNGDEIIETYCRCDGGSYGFTCQEGYRNPCTYDNEIQFYPADPSLPRHYFIHCSWTIPYLKRCPRYLVWDQDQQTCDWEAKYYAETKYTSYETPKVVYSNTQYKSK